MKVVKRNTLLLVVLTAITYTPGCYYDVEEELYPSGACDTTNVTYSLSVKPILDQNCNICHATGSTAGGGIVLDTYSGVNGVAQTGQLMGAIKHESGYSQMPKNAVQLDDCSIS